MKWLRRNALRLLIALGTAALALGYVPESCPELGSILPRISPILSLFGALAARAWLGWLMLLGIPLLVLAFFKGRFFCWYVCPMGACVQQGARARDRRDGGLRLSAPNLDRPALHLQRLLRHLARAVHVGRRRHGHRVHRDRRAKHLHPERLVP